MQIHWTSYVFAAITAACIGFGPSKAQVSIHPKDDQPAPKPVKTMLEPYGPVQLAAPTTTIKIAFGPGGSIEEHRRTYNGYQNQYAYVQVLGGCYSACTLVAAHINPERLCFGPGAFLAFHSAQTTYDNATAQKHPYATQMMYLTYPPKIREWIDRNGGADKLPGPGQGYWTMYDRELWAMGYAKCQ